MKKLSQALFFILVAFQSLLHSQHAQVTESGNGAVASVNKIATQAGINAFDEGGNAIDAALATAFTLGVVDGHNSGIGGGCFILARLANGEILAIDGREMAPQKAHRDLFVRNGKVDSSLSQTGALAIGIPGSVIALHQLQERGGKLCYEQVITPAAEIAEDGFVIDSNYANKCRSTLLDLQRYPSTASIFTKNGDALESGDILVQKDLAKTYRNLAKLGPDYFYKGEFASRTSDWIEKNGGIVSKEDFAVYHTVEREAIHTTYRNYDIYGFPPPSSGGIHIAQMLNILETYDLSHLSETDQKHLLIETMKLAFADRAHWLGDSDFVNVPLGLTEKSYAATLAKKIDLNLAKSVPSHNVPPRAQSNVFKKHTTHIATADKEGNWVAITTTLNTSFGSKVTIPETGVLMNNQMDDFAASPESSNYFGLTGSVANQIEPGKRPLSSMSPTIVAKNGQPFLTLGAAGGPTIITQVLQTIVNYIDLELPIKKSLKTTRIHHQWKPDYVLSETTLNNDLRKELEDKGHVLKDWKSGGATQAIALENKEFIASSDPRISSQE